MAGEQLLIAAAQQGDLAAFNQIVLSYQALAYSVAYNLLGDYESAVDATQDGFIKAYKAIGSFRGSSLKSWLMRIVTNTCYDYLRSRQRQQRRLSSLDDLEGNSERMGWMADREPGPQDQAETRELGRALQRGFRALPADQRAVIILCDVEGFTYEEIADTMGIRIGTVKSRLSRARSRMRDYLLQQEGLLPTRHLQGVHAP